MDKERVRVHIDGGVAHVRLNRPEKRNALDLPMFEQLVEAGRQLGSDRSVRAVVLSGEGAAFSAGLDFKAFLASPDVPRTLLERTDESPANLAQRVAWVWTELPMPVVCALHGVAFGGGLQIALGADMRYAAPDAQLSVMEIKWGLVPDMSITKTLPRVVALDVARELTYTGRVVSGTEAKELGLVTRVERDPLAAALAIAKQIAHNSPHAIRAAKALFRDGTEMRVKEAFELETELQLALLGTPNQREAVHANFEKREPRFEDPTS